MLGATDLLISQKPQGNGKNRDKFLKSTNKIKHQTENCAKSLML